MSDHTKIEWTDATWNPITGCSVVSPGCTNCYAMRLAGTRLQHHPSRAGLTKPTKAGPVWTGEVRLNEAWLPRPMRWAKPRRIFVCAHGDLFHESVPDAWIDRVFAVMALSPQHTFQVLTKRADRMREYMRRLEIYTLEETDEWRDADYHVHCADDINRSPAWHAEKAQLEETLSETREMLEGGYPLPNVWLGVSVEDQIRADERIPDLLASHAAVRFINAEPLVGPVNLRRLDIGPPVVVDALNGFNDNGLDTKLDWVIVGGESGPGARDMDPDWARSLRDQYADAAVPFFMKQMARGAAIPEDLMIRQWPEQEP